MARSNVREKGRQYFGTLSQRQFTPPRGRKRAFTYCAGIHVLVLGGAPAPTLEWTEGRACIGRNLEIELEMWLLGYDGTNYAELSAQFAQKPAHVALYEQEGGDRTPWLQGNPWDHEKNPPQNTVGGVYLVAWPSSWHSCRENGVDSNVGFTAVCEGKGYSLGICVAGFEYFLARNARVKYRDTEGEFVGLFWEFKDEEGRLVVVTLRQNEFSQEVPMPEIQEDSGADDTA